mgnify:FL=1
MGKIVAFIFLSVLLCGCESVQRVVRVSDAETGVPISGAFVCASSADITEQFGTSGLYKTDAKGEVKIDKYVPVISIVAGKEGYADVSAISEGVLRDGTLETQISLKKERQNVKREARVEVFKPFPTDDKSQSILGEMRSYFTRRNTIMAISGESTVIDAKILVRDRQTKRPIANAMILVQQRVSAFSVKDFVVSTDSSGVAVVPLELVYRWLAMDAGKEGYAPSKRFKKDYYKHGVYTIELGKKRNARLDGNLVMVVSDTSEFSKRPTDNPLWERFKKYYKSAGGTLKYKSEQR